VLSLVIIGAAAGAAGYYAGGGFKAAGQVTTLNGAGSSFVYPLISAMAANYNKLNPNVQVNYQPVGSGAGITDFQAKSVDFAGTDAPLSASQRNNITTNIGVPLTIPESIGAVAIAYNLPGIATGLKLNTTVAAHIFQRDPGYQLWNATGLAQLNPSITLPSQPITVTHRSDGSGTTFIFSSWLNTSGIWNLGVSKSLQWPGNTIGGQGNQFVATTIQSNKYTIGYVELNYALSTSPPMTYSAVLNPAHNYVLPSLATTAYAVSNSSSTLPAGNGDWSKVSILNAPGAQTYPIASFTYLLVFQDLSKVSSSSIQMSQSRAQTLVNFLWYVVHNGQQQANNLSYVPLPPAVIALDESAINSITFNGSNIQHS
jgi:phosphate ABC transporter phosphate-binding protein